MENQISRELANFMDRWYKDEIALTDLARSSSSYMEISIPLSKNVAKGNFSDNFPLFLSMVKGASGELWILATLSLTKLIDIGRAKGYFTEGPAYERKMKELKETLAARESELEQKNSRISVLESDVQTKDKALADQSERMNKMFEVCPECQYRIKQDSYQSDVEKDEGWKSGLE